MDCTRSEWNVTKVSLGEFLRCCDQPINEEQAWALCFQCCHKMRELSQGAYLGVIKSLESIFIHSDGTVSFKVHHLYDVNKTQQLESKVMEHLGMVIYKALDWGIDNCMERELSEPLEKLISLLLKLDMEPTQPEITFQDVLKICENHLPRSCEAASYYRMICRVLFDEHVDLQKLKFTIQSSKKSLRQMDVEDLLENDSLREQDNYWASLWHDVISELQTGVQLRKAMEQPRNNIPPKEHTHSPYELLADDIRLKRYTLRKVKVSERKTNENSPKEPSLHDQLMREIKQPQKLRPSSTEKNESKYKDASVMPMLSLNSPCGNVSSVQNAGTGLKINKVNKQLLIPDLLIPEFQEAGWALEYNLGSVSDRSLVQPSSGSTDFSADCDFTPKRMSRQGDFKMSSSLNLNQQPFCRGKSKSLGSALQSKKHDHPSPTKRPSPTIAELIGTRYAMMVSEIEDSCQRYGYSISSRTRVCFHCHKQMIFLWPYRCHLCSSVICCDCCIKMSMPFRSCIHLPLNLIKALILSKDEDQAIQDQKISRMFEVKDGDCCRVPLVFEPHCLAQSLTYPRQTMMDWPSIDICPKCEQYVLHVLSTQQQCNTPRKRSRSWTELE